MDSPARSAGFTIVEALVALTILALAAAAAFSMFGNDIMVLDRDRREQDAVSLARSVLSQVGHGVAVRPSHLTGSEGTLRWSVDIGTALPDPAPAQGLAAYPVAATIDWRDERGKQTLSLRSVRLGPEPIAP